MILQALNRYYERLKADPDQDVAPFGFSRQKIAFCVVIEPNGQLIEIHDERRQDGKKLLPISVVVCGGAKPSGSGINPCFLWDNPAYMLGYKPDDDKPKRTRESFEAFRKKHLDVESEIQDSQFSAVCRFLESWNPASAIDQEKLVEIGTGFGCFRIRGKSSYVHDQPAVKTWWSSQRASENPAESALTGQCLVTGQSAPLARLHEPKVKGVAGAQSAGAAIVSFNLDAFESYGKCQSLNAPVSEQAAFQYCTALNKLLSDEHRRFLVGDATTVFWTEKQTLAEDFMGIVFDRPDPKAEDQGEVNELHRILKTIVTGGYPAELGEPDTPFYVLGLSPNAARISVRYWHTSTLGDLVENLHQHFEDLRLEHGPKDPELIRPWQIVRETVRDAKDIPPLLTGALMRSMLTGQPYPKMLLSALIRRIRADREVRYIRAAAIKACLNRASRRTADAALLEKIDETRDESAYVLGRLFAELEVLQGDANPVMKGAIRERYLSSAIAAPLSVFVTLLTNWIHYLPKLKPPQGWQGKPAAFMEYRERRILDLLARIHDIPKSLPIDHQGIFLIGYYQQIRKIFEPTD